MRGVQNVGGKFKIITGGNSVKEEVKPDVARPLLFYFYEIFLHFQACNK